MSKEPLTTYLGVDIFVTEDGKFWADLDERGVVRRVGLAALKRIIAEYQEKPVRALVLSRYEDRSKPEVIDVVEINKKDQAYDRGRQRYGDYGTGIYVYDEEAFMSLTAIHEEFSRLSDERREIIRGLRKLTQGLFEVLRETSPENDGGSDEDTP